MNKIKIRDFIRLFFACLFSFLYIPHLMCYIMLMGGGKIALKKRCRKNAPTGQNWTSSICRDSVSFA